MQLDETRLAQLIQLSGDWARRRSEQCLREGAPLPPELRGHFGQFFPPALLSAVRVELVAEIPNPDFYPALEAQGISIAHDLRQMAGLTLDRAILISRSRASFQGNAYASLLFHELVHVVQYAQLGIEGFMDAYLRGWVTVGQDYFRIPLEVEAYGLQARYDQAPLAGFSVPEAVLAARARERQQSP